jgi:hypothetical protein
MKISPATTNTLTSFSAISQSLLVKPGSKLSTRNAVNSVLARAEVEEVFPVQFAIYDLNQFLDLLRLSPDADIEFEEKRLVISSQGGETQYYYADPSLIQAPSDNNPTLEPLYKFTLTPADINTIGKTASIVSATMLSIVAKKGQAVLCINDPKNASSNNYKRVLGECEGTFDVKMAITNFNVVPDTYDVQVAYAVGKSGNKAPVFYLSSTTRKLTYLIAADATSKI